MPCILPSTSLLAQNMVKAAILGVYVLGILGLTKVLYGFMRKRGVPHNVAVYYNRKIVHMFAAGVVALLVPVFFGEAVTPTLLAFAFALLTYIPHKTGKLMYWFQTEENMYEVNFCIMWGISLFLLWALTCNLWIAIFPALMISFGDAVTGVVRNALFGRRTKHWAGNLAMLALVTPLGYAILGPVGGVTAAASAIVERYEFPPIDDNVLISLTCLVLLLAAWWLHLI